MPVVGSPYPLRPSRRLPVASGSSAPPTPPPHPHSHHTCMHSSGTSLSSVSVNCDRMDQSAFILQRGADTALLGATCVGAFTGRAASTQQVHSAHKNS